MPGITRALVEQAIAKDRRAFRVLIEELAPVVQARVARALLRRGSARARNVREEVKDLTHDIFVRLMEDDGRILRQWNPERGSFSTFVGLVAESEVRAILRSRRKSPWTAEPVPDDDLDRSDDSTRWPEQEAASREILAAVLKAVRAELTGMGLSLFELLFIERRSVEEVCAATGKSADAVHAWNCRLRKRVLSVAAKIMSDPGAGSRAQEDRA